MGPVFWVSGIVAVVATVMMITRLNPVHALMYLVVSLLAVAVVFYALGAPLVAALEVIIYAGAIMVLFVFVVMMLNLGPPTTATERGWLGAGVWVGPALLAALLLVELVYVLSRPAAARVTAGGVAPKAVGIALYGPYVIGVELVSFLLLAGLLGAFHVGRTEAGEEGVTHAVASDERAADAGSRAVRAGAGRPAGTP
jgi:NADH-quinone oxidoreductase subunit J